MLRTVYRYFTDNHEHVSPPKLPSIKWDRVLGVGYPLIGVLMFGHIWVNYPGVNEYGCPDDLPEVQATAELCGEDSFETFLRSAGGALFWPLALSVAINEELSE